MAYMLIDGNSIGYAAHMSPALTCDGEPVQAVFYTLNIIRRVLNAYPGYKPVVLWDGMPKARLEAYPEYKGKREDTTDKVDMRAEYHKQVPMIRTLLELWGIDQIFPTDCEADDVAYALTIQCVDRGKPVLLITGDKDWLYYMVGPLVKWHDPRDKTGKTCTWEGFKEFTGYKTTRQFLQAKALLGDISDNIRGIDGIGPKCSQAIADHFDSVESLLKAAPFTKGGLPPELNRFLSVLNRFASSEEEIAKFNLNVQLMSPVPVGAGSLKTIKGVGDMEKFSDACQELKFFSITRAIDNWKVIK